MKYEHSQDDVAQLLIKGDPENLTLEVRKEKGKRKKNIHRDIAKLFGAAAVAPYAIRAKDGAPVATP